MKPLRVLGFIGGGLLLAVGVFPFVWAAIEGINVVSFGALIYVAVALIGIGLLVAAGKAKAGRPCPQCGKTVKLGLVTCPTCNFDFTLSQSNRP